MTDTTPLDRAHATMTAAPDDEAARLGWYRRFADSELCLLLDREADGDTLAPRLFPLEDGPVVLAFDGEEKLGAFADGPVPYAALPGRVIAAALAGQGLGIGVNMGAASAFLMPPAAVDWLANALAQAPEPARAAPLSYAPPAHPDLAAALAHGLAGLGGLASAAWLALARHADGRQGHVLVFEDAASGAGAALAKTAAEAALFSGLAEGLDVMILTGTEITALGLRGLAARVPLAPPQPTPARPAPIAPAAPGSDPDRPPRLR
jgi:hypothetical protein